MKQVNVKPLRGKSPRKVADHAFLRIHFEISKTMDLIDDLTEALTQALAQQRGKNAMPADASSKYYCNRCIRRRNARTEVAQRLKTLQILNIERVPQAA